MDVIPEKVGLLLSSPWILLKMLAVNQFCLLKNRFQSSLDGSVRLDFREICGHMYSLSMAL